MAPASLNHPVKRSQTNDHKRGGIQLKTLLQEMPGFVSSLGPVGMQVDTSFSFPRRNATLVLETPQSCWPPDSLPCTALSKEWLSQPDLRNYTSDV